MTCSMVPGEVCQTELRKACQTVQVGVDCGVQGTSASQATGCVPVKQEECVTVPRQECRPVERVGTI